MTQLIINGTELPYLKGGGYTCRQEALTRQITMASGRMVQEVIGTVWVVEYSGTTMANDTYRSLIGSLSGVLDVQFLPDNGDELIHGSFLCTERPRPKMAFAHHGEPVWEIGRIALREVSPHDTGESGTGAAIPAARGVAF